MSDRRYSFDSVEQSIAAIKNGELVVVMDDEDRENEGDLVMAAQLATKEQIALMIRHTSGILCVPMTQERAETLKLPPMVTDNTDPKKTAFTVSCDLKDVSTGVSAEDRAKTIRALADGEHSPDDFHRPGHIFPLVAKPNGVLQRRGHTEATVDLCVLAGLKPVGILAELTNDDGTMSRLPDCYAFAKAHNLKITTVEALVKFREMAITERDVSVEVLGECEVPIQRNNVFLGNWKLRCYKSHHDGLDKHIAMIKGDVRKPGPVLVRVHSECFTGHVLGSMRCDCSEQMDIALQLVNERGAGVVLYVDGHEGRGIGLHHKLNAYHLQMEHGLDTYQANEHLGLPRDSRTYGAPRAILKHLGISEIDLITNNPLKAAAFKGMVRYVIPAICTLNEHNERYISAKRVFEDSLFARDGIEKASASEPWKKPAEETAIKIPGKDDVAKLKIGVLTTSWNESLVKSISSECVKLLLQNGIKEEHVLVAEPAPGAFELPFAARALATSGKVDAILCFGVLIKGETAHYENSSNAVSQGLMQVQLSANVPIINGILHCLSLEQAKCRCNSGSILPLSLANTAIKMASFKRGLQMNELSAPMLKPCSQS